MINPTHTVGYFLREDEILLGKHKRGVSEGFWNGYGGKIEPGESPEESLVRECYEECGLKPLKFEHVANLKIDLNGFELNIFAYLISDFTGDLIETSEMKPCWYPRGSIPYDEMWPDDKHWIPKVLSGNKIEAKIKFDTDRNMIEYQDLPLN